MDKIEWMLEQLNEDDFYPSHEAVEKVLAGNAPEHFEPALIDYIEELESEWQSNQ